MAQTSGTSKRTAFSRWLRTGTVPSALGPDGLELKFNPWHDPADGRFTFPGAGRHDGSTQTDTTSARNDGALSRSGRAPSLGDRHTSRTATPPKAETPRARPLTGDDPKSVERRSAKVQSTRIPGSRPVISRTPSPNSSVASVRDFMMLGKEPWRESMLR
jgi:hypothetical protein